MADLKISEIATAPNFNAADRVTGVQAGNNANFTGTLIENFIGRSGGGMFNLLALKAPLASPNFTGTVTGITKGMVGLGSVDNTSDADKPISTAQAAVNAAKANLASPALTGIPLAPTAAPGTNTTQIATTAFVMAAVGSGVAGVSSFNTRTGAVMPASGDYTKAQVGLPNVDNTSDAAKPVSTAQQTALDGKANLAVPVGIVAAHTLVPANDGNSIVASGSSPVVITIPTGLRLGFTVSIWQFGTGAVSLTPAGGVTLSNRQGFTTLAGQFAGCTLTCVGTNNYLVQGDMA